MTPQKIVECPDCGKEICLSLAVIDDLIIVTQEEMIKCEYCDFESEKESDFHWFSFPNKLESICDNCFQEKGRCYIPKPIEEKPKPKPIKPKPKLIKESKPKPIEEKPKPKPKFTNMCYPEGFVSSPPPSMKGDRM